VRQPQSRGTVVPAVQAMAPREQPNAEGLSAQDIAALQSRITTVERDLRDTGSLMKLESLNPFGASALSARAEQMQEQLKQARELRQDYEAKASRLEQLLQQERKEREAWLDTFSKALQKTLKDLSTCVDQSIAESNKLMKGKLDVADATMHKIITQLNSSLCTPGTQARSPISTPVPQTRPAPGQESPQRSQRFSAPDPRQAPGQGSQRFSAPDPRQAPGQGSQRFSAPHPRQAPGQGSQRFSAPDPRQAPGQASDSAGAADLANSMAELLKENQLLQQKQQDLMKQRSLRHGRRSQPGSGMSSGLASPSGLVTSPGVALVAGEVIRLEVPGLTGLATVHERG